MIIAAIVWEKREVYGGVKRRFGLQHDMPWSASRYAPNSVKAHRLSETASLSEALAVCICAVACGFIYGLFRRSNI